MHVSDVYSKKENLMQKILFRVYLISNKASPLNYQFIYYYLYAACHYNVVMANKFLSDEIRRVTDGSKDVSAEISDVFNVYEG